jgi:hypothetical protein
MANAQKKPIDGISLFQFEEPSGFNSIKDTSRGALANYLSPYKEGGNISVVDNYRWTLTPKQGREEVPWAYLKEYRLLDSSFINSARYYATGAQQQIGGVSTNSKNEFLQFMPAYAGLFDFDNPTGFSYTLPYFSEISSEVRSSWTSLDITDKIKSAVGKISPGAENLLGLAIDSVAFAYETNYPRVGIMDRPKLWESSEPRSINIRFPLYNTVEFEDIQKNWELSYLLMYQNLFNKRDFITALPPVFYSVLIPGQYFTIAAYVSDMKIYNRGNIRGIPLKDNKRRNIPDAFEIDITLTDMVMPSQNMHSAILFQSPITVRTKGK